MKTIFNSGDRYLLIGRINTLDESSTRGWGKTNVHQMVMHCVLWDDAIIQNKKLKRPFVGILLGRIFLNIEMKNPIMRRNNPTVPELIVSKTEGTLQNVKQQWIDL